MRFTGWAILLWLSLGGMTLRAQPTYDLQVIPAAAPGDSFAVTLQMRHGGTPFSLGSSNLVFTYNDAAIVSPRIVHAHRYSGGNYNTVSLTAPTAGVASVNIELFAPLNGLAVPDTFTHIVTLIFVLVDSQQTSTIDWQTQPPNRLVVFDHDEATLIDPGVLTGLDIPLAIEVAGADIAIPAAITLRPNFPNPFNPVTTVKFGLPHAVRVTLAIYDVLGRRMVVAYRNTPLTAGWHSFRWDGRNDAGQRVSSGVYFYRLMLAEHAGGAMTARVGKMLLTR